MGSQKFRLTFDNKDDVEKEEESEVYDEELYEEIEAPKFVDFTKSDDPFRPDDRFWFCQRVGCDLKHEEELDPEEISKKFVLRVMAARSPNIRFRKALNGRNNSTSVKCPHSAPAKSAKSRVSRLAMLSSISQMSGVNGKVARAKISSNSTPLRKSRIVAAKYMTTPRNKKCLPTSNNFRSVQNTRTTTVQVPKSRKVAKSLVFHSPKKAVALKKSVELHTPLTKLCEGMKRLEITSQSKRVLGYSSKSFKETRCASQMSMPVDALRRQLTACNEKSRVKNVMHPRNIKDQGAKSVRSLKCKSKQITSKDSTVSKASRKDTNDIRIDVKSKDGSAKNLNPVAVISNDSKEVVLESKVLALKENSDTLTDNTADGEMNSLLNMEKRASQATSLPRSHALNEKGFEGSEGTERECNSELIMENDEGCTNLSIQEAESESKDKCNEDKQKPQASDESRCLNDGNKEDNQIIQGVDHENEITGGDKENCQASVDNTCLSEGVEENNQTSQELEQKTKYVDGDDKENVKISDGNSDLNNTAEKRILGCKETNESKKVVRALDKRKKDGLTSATICTPSMKYGKPKLTNPKPFRLRTDERGILKVANTERKVLAPQKEPAPVLRVQGANCQRRHENTKGNEKFSELNRHRNDKCSCNESEERVQKVETKRSRIAGGLKSSKAQIKPKLTTKTPQRDFKPEPKSVTSQHEPSKDNAVQRLDGSSRKKTMQQLVRPLKNLTLKRPPSVIEESSSTSNLKETQKPNQNTATRATKGGISAGTRSLSKEKTRPLSIKVA